MLLDTFFVILIPLVSSQISAAVVKENTNFCSPNEFACNDGACLSFDSHCDGKRDCADGSDEMSCSSDQSSLRFGEPIINRMKRQINKCRKGKWQCRDGTCIDFDGKCDGRIDCPDASDETFALCRKMKCQSNWFRCTYGACVDGTAPCNNIQECADNSDELLPNCRNENVEVRGRFKCEDGSTIPASSHCDGVADCPDGSDESVRSCAAKVCQSYLFQCAYGACVDSGADCNGVQECADGSDESDELCNRIGTAGTTTTVSPPKQGRCILPAYPDHGHYVVSGAPNAAPGQGYHTVLLNVSCNPGYGVDGDATVYCIDGSWLMGLPKCVRFCKLNKHPSVEYKCLIQQGSFEGSRDCNDQEPAGTIVRPQCMSPNYYYSGVLNFMRCIDGSWDYVAICTPGLQKNGTNITVLASDKLQVFVSNYQYYVPIFDVGITENTRLDLNTSVTVTDEPINSVNDINEEDWRMGSTKKRINIHIDNAKISVDGDAKLLIVNTTHNS